MMAARRLQMGQATSGGRQDGTGGIGGEPTGYGGTTQRPRPIAIAVVLPQPCGLPYDAAARTSLSDPSFGVAFLLQVELWNVQL